MFKTPDAVAEIAGAVGGTTRRFPVKMFKEIGQERNTEEISPVIIATNSNKTREIELLRKTVACRDKSRSSLPQFTILDKGFIE